MMKLYKIINSTVKPEIYEQGTAQMWTDSYISKQLLEVHLNKELDLASRKMSTIESTVEWILSKAGNDKLNILDLGCGPGLYTELLAKKGHKVTGVDFSKHSINYAIKEASKKNLNIKYIHENYLKLELPENSFDLVIIIFTDFGVLTPNERSKLLGIIKKTLKPKGIFIFDVLNDHNFEDKVSPKNWEVSKQGFWRNEPYIALSESFLYQKNKLVLNQHIIIDEKANFDIFRFWIHFFSHEDLTKILEEHNFNNLSFYENVLPEENIWSGKNVTFCKAVNNK